MRFDVNAFKSGQKNKRKTHNSFCGHCYCKVRIPRINGLVSDESLSSLSALHPNTQVHICSPGRNRKLMEDGGVEAAKVSHLALPGCFQQLL